MGEEGLECNKGISNTTHAYLLSFPLPEEAKRVLLEGKRQWGGCIFLIDVWHPRAGCWGFGQKENGRWIRIYGLPMHLWTKWMFTAIGNACGGFIKMEPHDLYSVDWI